MLKYIEEKTFIPSEVVLFKEREYDKLVFYEIIENFYKIKKREDDVIHLCYSTLKKTKEEYKITVIYDDYYGELLIYYDVDYYDIEDKDLQEKIGEVKINKITEIERGE